jgi:hypothetical protein
MRTPSYPLVLTVLALCGALLLLAIFSAPLLLGTVFVEDDLSAYWLPTRAFFQDCLSQGDSYLWIPHMFNGFYFHGEGQGGFFHPLHQLLYRVFPLESAFMLNLLWPYPFLFAGTYFFLRRWLLARPAALYGATLFAFIGINMNHYVHLCFPAVLGHVFWQLWAVDHVMRGEARHRGAMIFGVIALSASQVLLGSPQFTYCSWLVEAMYVLFLLAQTKRWGSVVLLGGAKALAVLVGMVQLLPTFECLRDSFRQEITLDFVLSPSLHPVNLLQLVSPYMFHRRVYASYEDVQPWDAPYLGALATVLLLFLVLEARHMGKRRVMAYAALFLTAFGLLAALGRFGVLYPLFQYIPLVRKIRAPSRYVALAHVGLTVVAALGWHHLWRCRDHPMPWRRAGVLLLPGVASALVWIGVALCRSGDGLLGESMRAFLMPSTHLAVGCVLLFCASALVAAAARGRQWAFAAMIVFTCVDIGLYSLRNKPTQDLAQYTTAVDVPEEADAGLRLDSDIHTFYMNRVILRDFRAVYGYSAMEPNRKLDYTQELPLRLANVTWRQARLLATPDLHAAKMRGENWVPFPSTLPRVRLVTDAQVSDTPMEDLSEIDLATTALVKTALELEEGAPGAATLQEERPGYFKIRTQAPERQLLVVSESYHRGWRVRRNGAINAEKALPVYGDFLGYVVESGESELEFSFEPRSYYSGRALSILGILLSLAYAVGIHALSVRKEV